jgi:flagellar basal-body rod protein FlgB
VQVSINFKDALGIYESALQLRSQRAEILSGNLANVDTPNFKARDFDFSAALDNAMTGTTTGDVRTTQARHLPADGGGAGVGQLFYRTPTQPSIDGNTVDEHIEHAEFMSNNLEFQTAFTLLNSRFKGLLSAIRGD